MAIKHAPIQPPARRAVAGAVAVAALLGALLTSTLAPIGLVAARAAPAAAVAAAAGEAEAAPGTYLETFDGNPASPQRFTRADWDVTINNDAYYPEPLLYEMSEPVLAGHGPDCAAPGQHNEVAHGPLRLWEDAVYVCRDHVMTAFGSGYGAVWLTPPALLDFSAGEAVLRFDMSTFRSANRDWTELWVIPWGDDLQTLNDSNDLFPRNGVRVEMAGTPGDTYFKLHIYRDGVDEEFAINGMRVENAVTPSAVRRDTFELRLSRTHLKFGMPAYNAWAADRDIAPLTFDAGVVHLGQYSYNTVKDYPANCPAKPCAPNTWHWDNVALTPAAPFAIQRAQQRYTAAGRGAPGELTFSAPAPAGAHLRFAGRGRGLRLSFDGGATWAPAPTRAATPAADPRFASYWAPVPAGATRVLVQGDTDSTFVHSVSLWTLP